MIWYFVLNLFKSALDSIDNFKIDNLTVLYASLD